MPVGRSGPLSVKLAMLLLSACTANKSSTPSVSWRPTSATPSVCAPARTASGQTLTTSYSGEAMRAWFEGDFGRLLACSTAVLLGVQAAVIIAGNLRIIPTTVDTARYAQSLTDKPMKGMLTGPVTMLQWSFVRDDQPRAETCRQVALAIPGEDPAHEDAHAGPSWDAAGAASRPRTFRPRCTFSRRRRTPSCSSM